MAYFWRRELTVNNLPRAVLVDLCYDFTPEGETPGRYYTPVTRNVQGKSENSKPTVWRAD